MEESKRIEGSIETSIIKTDGEQTTALFNTMTSSGEIVKKTAAASNTHLEPASMEIMERTVDFGRSFWKRGINVSLGITIPMGVGIQFSCSINPESVKETIINKRYEP